MAIVKDGRVLAVGPPARARTSVRRSTRSPTGTANGERIERQTEDPTRLLNELTNAALERGERLEELSVGSPTLEDVYLELTADE